MLRLAMVAVVSLALGLPAFASGGGGGGGAPGAGSLLTREEARAKGANTVSRSQCIATCQTRSTAPQNCPNFCVPPNCYAARNGGAYCVK